MSKIRVETMSKDKLMALLCEALTDVKDWEARRMVLARLREHLRCLERLQQMPYEQRAVFWKCYYQLFDYLRIHGQVQREADEFDAEVKENVKEILKELHTGLQRHTQTLV